MLPYSEFTALVDRLADTLNKGECSREALRIRVVIALAYSAITAEMLPYERDVVRTARWLIALCRRMANQIEAAQESIWHTLAHVRDNRIN